MGLAFALSFKPYAFSLSLIKINVKNTHNPRLFDILNFY